MVCESACLLVYVTKMYLHNRRRTLEDFKTKKGKKKRKKKKQTLQRWRRLLRAPNRTVFLPLWCLKDSTEKHLILFLLIPMSDFSGTYIMYGLCWKRRRALPNLCFIHTLRNTKKTPKECSSFADLWACVVTGKEKKGIVVWLSLPPRPVLSLYITTVAQEQFSVYM